MHREAQRRRSRKPITAGLLQATNRIHSSGAQPHDQVARTDQRQCFLLCNGPVRDRPEYLGIEPRETSQLFRIYLIALPIAVRDRPQLAHVRDNHLVAHLLKLLVDPDGGGSRLHRNPHWRQIGKPSFDRGRCGAKPASVDHLAFFVERAVMTPDVAKIDPNRHLNPGDAPWYFRDEVLCSFFHPHSVALFSATVSSHFGNLLPISATVSSHLSVTCRRNGRGPRTCSKRRFSSRTPGVIRSRGPI